MVMEEALSCRCSASMVGAPAAVLYVTSPHCSPLSANSSSARPCNPEIFRLWKFRKPCVRQRTSILRAAYAAEEYGSVNEGRRQTCFKIATIMGASLALPAVKPSDAAAREVEVGEYLPASTDDPRFVQFRASSKDTPALRAGNVQPYKFVLPPTWKQERVANILSGNYCQPKCAEPWVEVKFANSKQGAIQVVAAPMVRLTNKINATIEEIGSPEKILAALGPFVTGNTYDPDEVTETSVQHRGDQTYYSYQLETPYAKTGAHNLATATAKGSVVMLFVVSASDAQWSSSETLLRSVVDSFGV